MEKKRLGKLQLLNKQFLLSIILIISLSKINGQTFVSDVSKTGTTAGAILDMPINARGLALGNAVGGLGYDASSVIMNPAVIANTPGVLISASYLPWFANTDVMHFAVMVPVNRFAVGAYINSWTMDDMLVRTEVEPLGTGELFGASDFVFGLTAATALTSQFSIGANIKYIQENIWHSTASAFAIDFGTSYKTEILKGLSIIAVLSNYGTDMQLNGRDKYIFSDPDRVSEGNNENIPAEYTTDKWSLPLNFRFGIAGNIIQNDNLLIQAEIDATHPSNNYEAIDVGIEASFRNLMFLRSGWSSLLQKDSIEGISIGAGVKLPMVFGSILVDYGFRDFGKLGTLHAFTMSLIL